MGMNPVRVGLWGIGRAGHNMHCSEIDQYPDRFQIVAACDIDESRVNNLVERYHCAGYTSGAEFLNDPNVELVAVAVRSTEHVDYALKALKAGKIVFLEKPFALTPDGMKLLEQAVRDYPGKLYFRHNRRFEAPFVKVRELINSGLIGEVQYIKLYRSVGFCRRNDWMTMTDYYGGLLSNWGPHLIDQALRLLDSPVVDLWADVRRVVSIGDGDDLFKILLKAENGRLADIEVTGANTMPGREMEIIGSRGTIVYNEGKLTARYIDPSVELKDLKPHPENPPKRYGNFDETLYFVNAEYQCPDIHQSVLWTYLYDEVTKGIPSPIKLEEGLETVRITEEAFRKSGFEPIKRFKSKL